MRARLPPVGLVALLTKKRQRARRSLPLRSARSAEVPKLTGKALVVMDQIVELEGIDPGCVKFGEARTHVLQQPAQLFLVIRGDHLARLAASTAFSGWTVT